MIAQAMRDRVRSALALVGCVSEDDAVRLEAEVFHASDNASEYTRRFTALFCALRTGATNLDTVVEKSALDEAASRELPAVEEAMPQSSVGHSSVTCRCGSREVSDRTVQARCADEAPDVFYACRSCGRTWRG